MLIICAKFAVLTKFDKEGKAKSPAPEAERKSAPRPEAEPGAAVHLPGTELEPRSNLKGVLAPGNILFVSRETSAAPAALPKRAA
jgi:hypothetical protein